mmetsp:Transcript_541/g.1000  ORF Transcript_541/g.1000 Transcript_541/m.1000 type:complete len:187 (-) Transcript_541:36-596(-)
MLSFIAKNLAPAILGCALEHYFNKWDGQTVPRLFGGVIIVNVVVTTFVLIGLGFKVGGARSRLIEKAKKSGDEHAEARFSYPKIYAEGFSAEANEFNCVQRGHQHALESYPSFVALSLVGGLGQPIFTMLVGILWVIARQKWAQGYATGKPGNRYDNSMWGRHIWTALLLQATAAIATALSILLRA